MSANNIGFANASTRQSAFYAAPSLTDRRRLRRVCAAGLGDCVTAHCARGRYPNALTALVSALEVALQAAPIGGKESYGLVKLLEKAAQKSQRFNDWDTQALDELRELRNRFVHRGFSEVDNDSSVRVIVKTGLPLFCAAFSEFLDFSVVDGLMVEQSTHLEIVAEVLRNADELGLSAEAYCFKAFGASVRWSFKDSLQSSWEARAIRS